jgi:hypothetical protein
MTHTAPNSQRSILLWKASPRGISSPDRIGVFSANREDLEIR